MLLSSEYVPHIQPVHQEQPSKLKTLLLLAQLESHIQMKDLGVWKFLKG
jgi:hypothetical protein